MGFRTVVILSNDDMSDWEKDADLGRKISLAGFPSGGKPKRFEYGSIFEVAHCDTLTVAVLDSLGGTALGHSSSQRGESDAARDERLFRQLADKLGYAVSVKRNVRRLQKMTEKRKGEEYAAALKTYQKAVTPTEE